MEGYMPNVLISSGCDTSDVLLDAIRERGCRHLGYDCPQKIWISRGLVMQQSDVITVFVIVEEKDRKKEGRRHFCEEVSDLLRNETNRSTEVVVIVGEPMAWSPTEEGKRIYGE